MNSWTVYKHITPNGKVYIGVTSKDVETRWKNGNGYKGFYFEKAIKEFGWNNIKHEVICSGLSEVEAWKEEQRQIILHKSNQSEFGYNKSIGGVYPAKGTKHTDEWKQMMSQKRKGSYLSEQTKEKISKTKKGCSNGLIGRLGKECAKAGRYYQIDKTTRQILNIYYGIEEVYRKTGFSKTPIREAAIGIRKSAYGYFWLYEKKR